MPPPLVDDNPPPVCPPSPLALRYWERMNTSMGAQVATALGLDDTWAERARLKAMHASARTPTSPLEVRQQAVFCFSVMSRVLGGKKPKDKELEDLLIASVDTRDPRRRYEAHLLEQLPRLQAAYDAEAQALAEHVFARAAAKEARAGDDTAAARDNESGARRARAPWDVQTTLRTSTHGQRRTLYGHALTLADAFLQLLRAPEEETPQAGAIADAFFEIAHACTLWEDIQTYGQFLFLVPNGMGLVLPPKAPV